MNTENVVEKGAVYASVYGELADAIGEENMKKVYDLYRGVKVDFPKRMYAKQYVINQLKNLAGKKSVSELARKFDYSERYIRKLLAEGREGGKEV